MQGPIDTHSHAWSDDWAGSSEALLEAKRAGVGSIVLTAGGPENWKATRDYARRWGFPYMLGVHPFCVRTTTEDDLARLDEMIGEALADPLFIGLGEVGLDGVESLDQPRCERVFARMLRAAKRWDLPMSVHVRKSASRLICWMHREGLPSTPGVLHAFNGSDNEREEFRRMGFRFGFGGAAVYEGSRKIRRHLTAVDSDGWVLETDAPDMPNPARRLAGQGTRPVDLMTVLETAAMLRGLTRKEAAEAARANALAAFPRLKDALACVSASNGGWSTLGCGLLREEHRQG